MADDSSDFPVLGERCRVDLAQWSGRNRSLEEWWEMDAEFQAAFYNRFRRLALTGSLPSPEQMRPIGDDIHEIRLRGRGRKAHQRAACFADGKDWMISHWFETTHKKAAVAAARERAKVARQEHMTERDKERRNRGTK